MEAATGGRRQRSRVQQGTARSHRDGLDQSDQVTAGFGEMSIAGWRAAGLFRRSVIKPVLFTIAQHLAIRALGRLAKEDLVALKKGARALIG